MNTPLIELTPHRYLALETMRRSGAAVVTPVWFVAHNNRLYFSAPAHTGKVKRLRHTAQARIAPCDERGRLLGEWLPVRVAPVSDEEAEQVDKLLARRYGWQRRLLDAFGWLRRWQYVIYGVELR
jgi:uncharacterized protein